MNIKINNPIPVNIQSTKTIKMDRPFDITMNEELYNSIDFLPKNWKGVIVPRTTSSCRVLNLFGEFQQINFFKNDNSCLGISEQFIEIETNDKRQIKSVTLLYYKNNRVFKIISKKDYGIIKSRFEYTGKTRNKDRGVIPYSKCNKLPYEGKMRSYIFERNKVTFLNECNFVNGYKNGVEKGKFDLFDDSIQMNEYNKGILHGISFTKSTKNYISELSNYQEYNKGELIFSVEFRRDHLEIRNYEINEIHKFKLEGCFNVTRKEYERFGLECGFNEFLPKLSEKFPLIFKKMGFKTEWYLVKRKSKTSYFDMDNWYYFRNNVLDKIIDPISIDCKIFVENNINNWESQNDNFETIIIEGNYVSKTYKLFRNDNGNFKKIGTFKSENDIDLFEPNRINDNIKIYDDSVTYFNNKRNKIRMEIEEKMESEIKIPKINEVYPMD